MVDPPAFDFNPPSRALPETQDNIRLGAHQCIDELLAMKPHWENALCQSRPPRQTCKNAGGDIIRKRPVRAKTVNQDTLVHRSERRRSGHDGLKKMAGVTPAIF